jgi:hypothetical protein
MGRIRQTIRVDGHDFWALFDTGTRNTYIVPPVARLMASSSTDHPIRTALGGQIREINSTAVLKADIEGHKIATHAMVVDEIGKDEDGRPIEVLFGALAMQQWGIRPVPDQEKLDLTHFSDEFVEF